MDKKHDYEASNIQILKELEGVRENFDIFKLANEVEGRGSLIKLANKYNIRPDVLNRAVNEAKFSKIFPNLEKSKLQLFTYFKLKRELKLFLECHDIYNLSYKKLIKELLNWKINLEKNPLLLISQEQHDLIIGSTMGDANIRNRGKNCLFRVGHSRKQKKYLEWKYNILNEFIFREYNLSIRKFENYKVETFNFETFCHPIFNFYYKLFYKKNNKKITKTILNQLNERSLAIWICDDGSYCNKQGNITLCTNSFSLEEHKLIKNYFNKKWKLDPTIGFRDKKYYYLRFKKDDSIKLISIIKNFIPVKEMLYKTGGQNGRL